VDLVAPSGELLVLLGPSGCGKTTLLKTVNRLVEPTGGRVLLGGEDVRAVPATALRRRIGYAIQATGLFPHLRVAENVAVVPRLLGWPTARIEARVDELLGLVGLPLEYRTRWPRQLSGGEAQRVGIARALAADPAYLLMDEPFGALDAITRQRLQAAMRAIQARLRKTILFVTHDVDEALRLADRVAVLREGRLVQVATPLALLSQPADAFVADLVGAADTMRRLRLLRVADALAARPAKAPERGRGEAPIEVPILGEGDEANTPASDTSALQLQDDLGTALSRLLESPSGWLPVVGAGAEPISEADTPPPYLTLADLRRVARGTRAAGVATDGPSAGMDEG
jgi:osmoprotectant transport system ATP-binding protein